MSKVQECRAALIEALRMEKDGIDAEIVRLSEPSVVAAMEEGNRRVVARAFRRVAVAAGSVKALAPVKLPDEMRLLNYVKDHPGCSGTEINKALGINAAQAMRLRAALGRKLVMKGKRRGARYSVRGGA